MPAPVQKVRHNLQLQLGKMRTALWERVLPDMLVAGGNEPACNRLSILNINVKV
jgi:hypothetical protein